MLEESLVTAEDLMVKNVISVRPDTPLVRAVTLMADHGVSGLPVLDDHGNPVGMLTEGDLLRWHGDFSEKQTWWLDHLADGYDLAPNFMSVLRSEHRKVGAIMSHSVTSVTADTPARDIARLFFENKIKRAPVMRDGKMIGLVSRSDLVKALATALAE